MKIKNILYRNSILLSLCVVTVCMCLISAACTRQEFDKNVLQAFELRMNGQADSAKVILEQVLSKDSTNAAAWYELARTKQHMGLNNPRELISGMAVIQQTVQKAVENDPDNVIYQFYLANIRFTNFYIALKMGKDEAKTGLIKVVECFKSVLTLDPDYHQAKLFLIELYAKLPAEMGGDISVAEKYTKELEVADIDIKSKAKEMVLPDDSSRVGYWQSIISIQQPNAEVYEALGKAYLAENDQISALKYFEKAIKLDANKNYLYMDLGRKNIMQAMRNPDKLDSLAILIENAFNTYISSQPEPINSFKAFALSKIAMVKFRTGNKEHGKSLIEQAMVLDPYYSKAFGTPPQILFDPPNEISHDHNYFFRPF